MKVLRALEDRLGNLAGLTFEVHAGSNYSSFGLADGLRAQEAALLVPAEHLSLGRQLSFYRSSGLIAMGIFSDLRREVVFWDGQPANSQG